MVDKKVKEKEKEKGTKLHPAAESWNSFVEKMEEARLLWERHRLIYGKNKATIGDCSRQTQIQLSGIFHQQKFEHILDHMVRYARIGFADQIIKE